MVTGWIYSVSVQVRFASTKTETDMHYTKLWTGNAAKVFQWVKNKELRNLGNN